jgi:hypothetical protein
MVNTWFHLYIRRTPNNNYICFISLKIDVRNVTNFAKYPKGFEVNRNAYFECSTSPIVTVHY